MRSGDMSAPTRRWRALGRAALVRANDEDRVLDCASFSGLHGFAPGHMHRP